MIKWSFAVGRRQPECTQPSSKYSVFDSIDGDIAQTPLLPGSLTAPQNMTPHPPTPLVLAQILGQFHHKMLLAA